VGFGGICLRWQTAPRPVKTRERWRGAVFGNIEAILLVIGTATTRKTALPDAIHRASRLTKWMPADHQPEGAGGFAPIPAGFGSTVALATLFTEILGLDPNPRRQNGSIFPNTAPHARVHINTN